MTRSAPGSSGASVTIRRWPREASTSRSTASRVGGTSCEGSCAPARRGESHGPSRWIPAMRPESTDGTSEVHDATSASTESVTRLATSVVVPCATWVSSTRATAAGEPPSNIAPPPPWTCTSTNPGTTRPGSDHEGRSGGVPVPTANTRSPSMTTQPSTTIPVGSASAPAETTRAPSGNGSATGRTVAEPTGRRGPCQGGVMIFIAAKFRVLAEHADDWPEITRSFTLATRAEPGNLWFDWSRSLTDPQEYVLLEAFLDDAAAAHVQSDHFKTAQAELPAYLEETPRVINTPIDGTEWGDLGELAVTR